MSIVIDICTKFINDKMILPEYAKLGDAGMDVQANIAKQISLSFGERILVKTGIFVALPYVAQGHFNWELQVRPRSGLAYKYGITVINSPGTIDSGYRNEIGVLIHNMGTNKFDINPGDRIAQVILAKAYSISWNEVSELDETERGLGGYGSTGTSAP